MCSICLSVSISMKMLGIVNLRTILGDPFRWKLHSPDPGLPHTKYYVFYISVRKVHETEFVYLDVKIFLENLGFILILEMCFQIIGITDFNYWCVCCKAVHRFVFFYEKSTDFNAQNWKVC